MTNRLLLNSLVQVAILFSCTLMRCDSTYSSPFSIFSNPSTVYGHSRHGLKDLKVIHGWKTVDFVFPNIYSREAMIRAGVFIPGRPIVLDVDFWQGKDGDELFVTLPRMKEGIPATLATVSSHHSEVGSPLLEPYPDWTWHRSDNCEGLVSAFRMKIDDCGRLWVIDSGVVDILHTGKKMCPPKIMVFDLKTRHLVMKYVIPESVLERESLLVTIAVDTRSRHCRDAFAYLADVTEFGLIVYDSQRQTSWRVNSNYFYPFPVHGSFSVAGSQFDLMDGVIGLALSPLDKYGDRTLYFHSLASVRESKVSTALLRNESNFPDGHNYVAKKFYITEEVRSSQSVAEDMSKNNILFFGLLSPVSIACWNSRLPYLPFNIVTVAQNNETLQFPSGVKIVKKNGREELLILSSRFPSYFLGKIDEYDVNFRILSATVDDLVKGTLCDSNTYNRKFYDSFE